MLLLMKKKTKQGEKMDLKQFMSRKGPKWGGIIWPLRREVMELHRVGYSIAVICEFLDSNGIKVGKDSVSRFVKKMKSQGEEFIAKNDTVTTSHEQKNFSPQSDSLIVPIQPSDEQKNKLAEMKALMEEKLNK